MKAGHHSAQAGIVTARWIEADGYLFDIDGTLLNSRDGVHYNAFRSALRKIFGVNASIDSVPVHGNTDIGILRAVVKRAGLSDAEFEERIPAVIEVMCAAAKRNSREMEPKLCPSIKALLAVLQRNKKLLGVVSGNLEAIGWLKLETARVRNFFSFGSFSGERELREDIFHYGVEQARERLGHRARICIVGDTPADIEAALNLNVPVIAVATGIYKPEELLPFRPTSCVTCCTELLELLAANPPTPARS